MIIKLWPGKSALKGTHKWLLIFKQALNICVFSISDCQLCITKGWRGGKRHLWQFSICKLWKELQLSGCTMYNVHVEMHSYKCTVWGYCKVYTVLSAVYALQCAQCTYLIFVTGTTGPVCGENSVMWSWGRIRPTVHFSPDVLIALHCQK